MDGKPVQEMGERHLNTKRLQPMQLAGGVWHLGNHVGRTIHLQAVIKPFGYPGYQLPVLHIDQLETGPVQERPADRSIAKDLLGRWRLRGAQSTMHKTFHNGPLSGGDGTLRIANDGTASMWLRLPAGDQKVGAGYVLREDGALVFDYANRDWTKDRVQLSGDGKTLLVQEQADKQSWHLEFARDELSSFADYVGQWTLQASSSKVHNALHDGPFAGGAGRLSVGLDGGFVLRLQYPLNAQKQVREESSTGQLGSDEGLVIFKYDDKTWNDDLSEWHAGKKTLTLREIGNEEKWVLTFQKQ